MDITSFQNGQDGERSVITTDGIGTNTGRRVDCMLRPRAKMQPGSPMCQPTQGQKSKGKLELESLLLNQEFFSLIIPR